MLKTLTMSAAVSALMVSGALAQATPPADKSANQPPAAQSAPTSGPQFIQAQSADQWVFSKFKGTNVIGPDDAKVGDVSDMLFDKNGKIHALIVGVGGFLGIGEKYVAIDLSAFQAVPASTGMAASPAGGTTGTGGAAAPMAADDPTIVKLKVTWTKDQLKNAPDFQYYRVARTTTDRPAVAPTTGMAPRDGAPAPAPVPAPRQ
jgi:sporulation protein YlmC with PRC-barrel domain